VSGAAAPVGVSDEDVEERPELSDRPRLDGLGPGAASSSSARSARPCCRWSGGWGGSSAGGPRGGRTRPRKPLRPPLGAREAGGEDHVVVGEGGGRHAVAGRGVAELGEDDGPGDAAVGGDRQSEACVVVEEGEDLDVLGVLQRVEGEVRLPHLARQFGAEAHVGRPRALLRLGLDEARPAQVAVDGGRRDRDSVVVTEVPADRLGPGVEAGRGDGKRRAAWRWVSATGAASALRTPRRLPLSSG
jgi:hypothetical protein